jgi:hypothetical protein
VTFSGHYLPQNFVKKWLNFSGFSAFFFMSTMNYLAPELRDFILFCVQRRGADWPLIYDEMALVAGQRLFNGLGRAELEQLGLSFSLGNVERTLELVRRAMSPDQNA